jgi:hypothetical protein
MVVTIPLKLMVISVPLMFADGITGFYFLKKGRDSRICLGSLGFPLAGYRASCHEADYSQ